MRQIVMIASAALALAAAPAASEAACQKRATGAVIGAVTGGLLGNAVAGRGDRTEGTLIGAAAGGLVGHQVSKCRTRTTRAYAPSRSVSRAAYNGPRREACRYEDRPYYDHYGRLVHARTRVCGSQG